MIFEAKNASVKQDLETLTAANAELNEKLLGLTTGETPLEKQKSINAELLADEKKVHPLVRASMPASVPRCPLLPLLRLPEPRTGVASRQARALAPKSFGSSRRTSKG